MSSYKFNALSGTFDLVLDKASEIKNIPSGNLSSTNLQDAVNELQSEIDTIPDPIYYAGTWNASTNTPTLANSDTGVTGKLYQVNVAGSVNFGAGSISFDIGDKVVNNGTIWEKWDQTDAVNSVNGQTGVVVLTTTDIAEGTNEYFTNTKAQAAITGAASTIVTSNLTVDRVLVSDGSGKVAVSSINTTTLGYLDATSSIQTQLNGKEPTITVLPISKGGTNSNTSLNNNRVMQSNGGAIVEAAAITANRALVSDANGIPTHSATTATEIGYINGLSSAVQTQLDSKEAKLKNILSINSNVTLTSGAIHLVDTSSARSLTLPTPVLGTQIIVKDAIGSANINNITIVRAGSEKIETVAASYVMDEILKSITLVSDGVDWFII